MENTKLEPKALCIGDVGKNRADGKQLPYTKVRIRAVCSIELETEN